MTSETQAIFDAADLNRLHKLWTLTGLVIRLRANTVGHPMPRNPWPEEPPTAASARFYGLTLLELIAQELAMAWCEHVRYDDVAWLLLDGKIPTALYEAQQFCLVQVGYGREMLADPRRMDFELHAELGADPTSGDLLRRWRFTATILHRRAQRLAQQGITDPAAVFGQYALILHPHRRS